MALPKFLARATTFAHLAGISSHASRASDDDSTDDKDKKDKDAKSKAKADDSDDGDEKKKDDDKSAKAGDSDDGDDKDDDGKDDKDKDAKGKKAKAAGDDESDCDDDKDEEMHGKSAAAQARRRERARCAAIFASPAAAQNVPLAASLAFNSSLPRSEAIAVLASTPAPAPTGRRAAPVHEGRQAGNPTVTPNGGAGATQTQAIDAMWDGARKANESLRR